MGILDSISGYLATRKAAAAIRDDPLLQIAVAASNEAFHKLTVLPRLSEKWRNEVSAQLLERVQLVSAAPDPRMKCRECLADFVIEMSQFQVLTMEPPPAEDPTGLRGTQGVSGELKPHLPRIFETDQELRGVLYGMDDAPKGENEWNYSVVRYQRAYWFAHVLNGVRFQLGDYNQVRGRDWYWTFLHAMCVVSEDTYRSQAGLPTIANQGSDLVSLMYSTFLNHVMSGAEYPDLEWRSQWADEIAAGILRPPARPPETYLS